RALSEFHPDLVLCDYNLPGYNGRAALDLVRRTAPQVPVLLLSASLPEDEAVACLKNGAADCLHKSNLPRLSPVVRRALREVTHRREYEAKLHRAAHYDALTSLPNTALLRERMTHAVTSGKLAQRMPALIVLDLDGFTAFDQGFGRTASD